ncbi:MAG: heavy metal sensor histidine kinase [Proteobacteria bacterium]|nr:heavy metal sensor histidine kinase [Pseudomonadota bacterium]
MASMLIVLSVSVAMYGAMTAQVRSVDEQVLMKRAQRVADILQTSSDIAFWLPHEVSEDLEGPRQVFMRVIDRRGVVVNETPLMAGAAPADLFPSAAVASDARPITFANAHGRQFRGLSLRVRAAGLPSGEATVQTAVDVSVDELLLGRFRAMLLSVVAPALLACALVAAVIAATLLAPLRRMAREAETLGGDAVGARLSAYGAGDEVSDVGRAFNGALERLQRAHEALRRYADNVAHEIRTPLNRMLLKAEIAAREPRTAEQYREVIEEQARECGELARLVQRLLFLARAENAPTLPERAMLDVEGELGVLRNYFESSATDAGISIVVECQAMTPHAFADRLLFQQAIGNLVTNAIAHARAGGVVRVVARPVSSGVEVAVIDTGSGIAAADIPHVFDRFYRSNPRQSNEGVGLGLAIAKSILDLHGGSIALKSGVGEGTTVVTLWPSV